MKSLASFKMAHYIALMFNRLWVEGMGKGPTSLIDLSIMMRVKANHGTSDK